MRRPYLRASRPMIREVTKRSVIIDPAEVARHSALIRVEVELWW